MIYMYKKMFKLNLNRNELQWFLHFREWHYIDAHNFFHIKFVYDKY